MNNLTVTISSLLLCISLNAQANDPISAITSLDNLLRATSLVDIVSKAIRDGADPRIIKTVPKLKVIADCSDCKLSNATKMLIKSSYNELAKSNDLTVNQEVEAVFIVTSIYKRNSFMRGTFGILSGADIIRGRFEGDEKTIGEHSVSHEMGLDEITQSLGEDLLKEQVSRSIAKAIASSD